MNSHDRIIDYLEQRWRAFVEGEGNVPCGECRGCCRSGYSIGLSEKEAAELEHTDIQVGGVTHHVILALPDGRCPNLTEDLVCAVYEKRPMSCRQYDCRDMALSAVRIQSPHPGAVEVNASIMRHYEAFGGAIVPMAEQAAEFVKTGSSAPAAGQSSVVLGILQMLPEAKGKRLIELLLSPEESARGAAMQAVDVMQGAA
jgi:hypothetical protein